MSEGATAFFAALGYKGDVATVKIKARAGGRSAAGTPAAALAMSAHAARHWQRLSVPVSPPHSTRLASSILPQPSEPPPTPSLSFRPPPALPPAPRPLFPAGRCRGRLRRRSRRRGRAREDV